MAADALGRISAENRDRFRLESIAAALGKTGAIPKKWREGGYLEKRKVVKDHWGNEFIYILPGVHGDFDLISYG